MGALGTELVFLKLGGSLITDKTRPHALRQATLARLADEIAAALGQKPGLRLVLGHGSGSFGHVPAKKYGTRQGVDSEQGWQGFAEVWWEASQLNRSVMEALHRAGVPALAFPPSAGLWAANRQVEAWNLQPLQGALAAGLAPVVYGDVVFDWVLGGTIFSTENLFVHLAAHLHPRRLLLAGIEAGVWADFPARRQVIPQITPGSLARFAAGLGGSAATDVTGGMASKVQEMLALAQAEPQLEVFIFSGEEEGAVRRALLGSPAGTRIAAG